MESYIDDSLEITIAVLTEQQSPCVISKVFSGLDSAISRSAFLISKNCVFLLIIISKTESHLWQLAASLFTDCPPFRMEGGVRLGENQKSRKPLKTKAFGVVSGTHGRIRTSGLPLRRRPLYPAELRGRVSFSGTISNSIMPAFPPKAIVPT